MASRFNCEPTKLLSTLKNTVFKNASDDELLALVVVANEYGLNPLTKEIYAFPAKGGGIVPVVSIDGWINRMNSNAQFDGIEFEDAMDNGKPVSVTVTIWRKDRARPIKVTEYLAECKRNTEPWNTMPARMLRHKALMQGVRVAFGFGGVYDEDEARDVAMRDVTPATPTPSKPKFLNAAPEVQPEPEAPPVTTEVVEEVADDSDQREALLSSIQEAMDADCITATQVRKWAHKNKLAESDKLALKSLPTDSLNAILSRWAELKGGVES
jgi:phage recombination protein Bet